MKKFLLLMLVLPAICYSQSGNEKDKDYHFVVGVGLGYSSLKELTGIAEIGIIRGEGFIYPTMVFEVYTSNQDKFRHWPVADFGPRMYLNAIRRDWGWIQLYGDYKFATNGGEHKGIPVQEPELLNGYHEWHLSFGGAVTLWLPDHLERFNSKHVYLKAMINYGPERAGRLRLGLMLVGRFP